ncbi:hypothetical protein [Fodinibius sediminis]|uniref:Uncharacterized protein n=1 Tax=Fodinibius sediminis TaxID=1214077 RepID=A0A521DKM0_9BACT|nr:hypothetical protein [Fodinibius sediminis]SMO71641.1 hypothetical protein SAMN06265218_110117 [Fodinibius sediminis]
MHRLLFFLTYFVCLLLFHGAASGQSVSIEALSPESPARLDFEQQVSITFEYDISNESGARIFIRPMTSGALTPNYSASGSSIFRGRGQENANFTIRSGNVTVDQLRVQVLSSDQKELLFEFYLPVDYTFSSSKYTLAKPGILYPKSKKILQQYIAKTSEDTSSGERKVVRQVIKEDGTIETHYSDGAIWGSLPSGQRYFINPETGDTSFVQTLKYEVQEASQPAEPPGFVPSTDSEADEDWLRDLNDWLEYLASQQLVRIQLLLNDEESFQNYQTFEEDNSSSLYQKISLRYTFLEKLQQHNIQ